MPQFVGDVVMSVVQAPLGLPSQLPRPAGQLEGMHEPLMHTLPAPQLWPQDPQLLGLNCRLTSHPFAGLMSQSA
jgi:hypothetical protein